MAVARMHHGLSYLLAIPLGLWVSLPALGQEARITGRIIDAHQSALPTVIVIATSVESGATREVLSNRQGYFQMAQLAPGNYRLEAVRPGYKLLSRAEVGLGVGGTATVELQMEAEEVSESVTLEGRTSAAGSLLAYFCDVSPGSGCEMIDTGKPGSDVTAVMLPLP
jgi:hypothetical protein